MAKYRKKPIIVEAVQYIKGKEVPAVNFLGGHDNTTGINGIFETKVAIFQHNWYDQSTSISIKTREGIIEVSDRDYIIKDINGEFYLSKPNIFEKTYEKVDEMDEIPLKISAADSLIAMPKDEMNFHTKQPHKIKGFVTTATSGLIYKEN